MKGHLGKVQDYVQIKEFWRLDFSNAVASSWMTGWTKRDLHKPAWHLQHLKKLGTCNSLTIILFGPPEQEMQNIAFTDILSLFFQWTLIFLEE